MPRGEGPVLVIHQERRATRPDGRPGTRGTHGRSGLIDKGQGILHVTEADAEQQILAFLSAYVAQGCRPLCGNTIGQDRRFLVKYMPKLGRFSTTAMWM